MTIECTIKEVVNLARNCANSDSCSNCIMYDICGRPTGTTSFEDHLTVRIVNNTDITRTNKSVFDSLSDISAIDCARVSTNEPSRTTIKY